MGEAEDLREIAEHFRRLPETSPSLMATWGIPLVLAVVGWITLYYSTIGELRTGLEQTRVRQEGVIARVAAVESWKESVAASRFTAQEGASLRSELVSMRQELLTINASQDARTANIVEVLTNRINTIFNRLDAIQKTQSNGGGNGLRPGP